MDIQNTSSSFSSRIIELLKNARQKVVQSVNRSMVLTYFEIGRMIIEEQQNGKERADYGKEVIKDLSKVLTKEFGKGYSPTNLKQMRQFFLSFSNGQTLSDISNQKGQTPPDQLHNHFEATAKSQEFKLSWSHYLTLMRIDDINERSFYEIESALICIKKS
ncbi:MAG: hypothetical protein KDC92_12155 [Bacteroidetes bacterium]|nr:hypothetical protein [Bacteroidota bacterium]